MRYKVYYPASQTISGLYTTGSQWMTTDGTEYVGFYHQYTDGTTMSGAEYNKFTSKHLIQFVDSKRDPIVSEYKAIIRKTRKLKPNDYYFVPRSQGPIYSYPPPTLKDYKKGKFVRYFIKRRNKSTSEDIFEVNKEQYISWKTAKFGIDEFLYDGIKIDWKLTGPLKDTGTPPNIEYGVEDTNKRLVFLKDREFKGLMNFLTNYIEWSVHSPLVSEDIKRMFGISS